MAKNVAIDVQIKNVRKISELKDSLKQLRKEQRDIEKATKEGNKSQEISSKRYKENAKAIDRQSKALRTLNRDQKDATKSNNSLSKSFIKAAAAIGIVVGAFRAVSRMVSSVVETFTEFEFVMAKVNAVSGATEREFAALTETAEELGRTTFFTATQVGELMLNFSKLGFTAREIQNAVQPTLDLATATGSDLARAATVAGAAVRGFALDASETERVVDVMAVSFSSSAMNIEKWQTSMTKVAPIAKSAGFSIEDTAAIMSKLTDSGIEASIAGTSLRNILLKMQDPNSELTKSFGSTIHSLDQLVPAMKKFVAEGGSMADVMEVVDLRQAAAFEQMLTTADGTVELRDAMLAANGEGGRMAAIVGDTLQGAFLRLKSALQGVSIELMGNYSKSLKDVVESSAKWLNNLAENSDKLVTLIKIIKGLTVTLLAYKLGVVAANAKTFIFEKGSKAAAGATGLFGSTLKITTAALATFGRALATTGVGAFVILLGDLATSLAFFNEEAREATDWSEKLNNNIKNEEKSVSELEISLNRLTEAKKEIDKFSKEEVKQLDKASYEYKIYAKSLLIATQETNTLNQAFKDNGEELINLQTDIKDTQEKFSNLAEQMRNTAAIAVASEMSSEIIRTKITADTVMKDLQELFKKTGQDLSETQIAAMAMVIGEQGSFDSWLSDTRNSLKQFFTGTKEDWAAIQGAVDDAGISMGDFVKYIDVNMGDWTMEDDLDGINKELKKLFPNFEDFIKVVGDSEKTINKETNSINENTKALTKNTVMQDLATEARFDYVEIMSEVLKGNLSLEASEKTLRNLAIDRAQAELDAIPPTIMNADLRMQLEEKIIKLKLKNQKEEEDIREKNLKGIKKEIKNYENLGEALITVAGDNEKLNGIRKAGEAITRAAAIAESILNVQKALTTVTQGKLNLATLLGTKTTIANTTATGANSVATGIDTGVTAASLGVDATKAALSSGKMLPWPINLIAFAATIVLIKKIMGMFEKGGVIDEGKFARGGMVHGASHAQGGVKFAVGGRVAELEGGEAVINKRSTAMFRNQLSEINQAGGGVKFADGGIMSSPSFTQAQFDAAGQNNMISALDEQRKVVVVESDITNSQSTVSVIQANATF